MQFLKKNPALAVGIGLPVLVVIFFGLATIIPNYFVDPPRYDALYVVNSPGWENHDPLSGEVKVTVQSDHLRAVRRKAPKGQTGSDEAVFLFRASTLRAEPMVFPPMDASASDDWQEVQVPALAQLKIDPSATAPDGYRFVEGEGYIGGGVLFFGGDENYRGPFSKRMAAKSV